MRLILTRHGETEENIQGIEQGHLPGKLSKLGVEQAKKLAERLKNEKFDVVYSSDLARASDTAKEIMKYQPNTPIFFVKELREFDVGSLTGIKNVEINWGNVPKDTESREDVGKRIKKLLDRVYEKYSNRNVLFVGHNGVNKILTKIIMNKPLDYVVDNKLNTAVDVFEIREDKNHKIHLLNCVKHLE